MAIGHLFVSTVPDTADPSIVHGSDWNANHVIDPHTITYAMMQQSAGGLMVLGSTDATNPANILEIPASSLGLSLLNTASAAAARAAIGLGNVENTALSTWAGSTNLITVGIISAGTWHGTAIADAYIASAATWNAKQNALGYTPVNVAGDTMLGALLLAGDPVVALGAVTKQYADNLLTGILKFKGSTNCSANPNYPAASKGDSYLVSVAGKIGGASGVAVDAGDMYVAIADNAGGTQAAVGSSWTVLEHNLQGALLSANNLSDVASASTSRTNLGLGNVENTALSTWAGTTNITTLGTIATGAWNGSVIGVSYGGTNIASYAVGDLLYASGSTTLSKLADVATGNALISGGVTTAPAWGKIGLTTHISGVLAETNGGTAQSTYTLGDLLYSSAANTLSKLAGQTTTTKKYLSQTGNGSVSAAPAWGQIAAADLSDGTIGTGKIVQQTTPTLIGDVTISSGNLVFSSTTQRITGDMNNANRDNRLAFQNSVVNALSALGILPNGSATQSSLDCFNNSSTTNSAYGRFGSSAVAVFFSSNVLGSGTSLPVDLQIGGNTGLRVFTSLRVNVGSTSPTDDGVNAFQVTGSVAAKHLVGNTPAPTIAAGAGAGTSPIVAVTGTDLGFKVSVTTGTLPTAAATVATVTFNTAYGVAPHYSMAPANAATALLNGATMVYSTSTTTTFVITAGATGLVAATAYVWEVVCVQ